jgi:hypothetical protein
MDTGLRAPKGDRARTSWLIGGATVFAAGVALGAYGDWVMWPVSSGIVLGVGILVLLFVSGMVAIASRGTLRRVALLGLALGTGLAAGQNLGPSREPLIHTEGGTMTLRLDSPVAIVATGYAACMNVASETEFAVDGQAFDFPTAHLPDLGRAVGSVSFNAGDRWTAIDDAPRSEGIRLDVMVIDELVRDDAAPVTVVMRATDTSSLEATFGNRGGRLRFAGLEARPDATLTGEPVGLAGVIEWTCGAPVSEAVIH